MVMPTYDQCMLPMLSLAGDGQEHQIRDFIQLLAQHFELTTNELEELLPSGRDTTFSNRVRWANTYLRKAGLLESTGRGRSRITELGFRVLQNPPFAIDKNFLMQFESFAEFQLRSAPEMASGNVDTDSDRTQTPQENLHTSYQKIKAQLAQELLDLIMTCSDKFFERVVVDLLLAMGYGRSMESAGQIVGGSGDGGVDGIIHQDKLGFDVIYIQAKRWNADNVVSRPIVQAFAGSLLGHGVTKGVLITTSRFSRDAIQYAANSQQLKINLIDGQQLAELMIEHNIGVSSVETYIIKKVDADYFDPEA